jgi:hypothetical protein
LEFSAVKGFGKFDLPHGTVFGVTDDDADIEASSTRHRDCERSASRSGE